MLDLLDGDTARLAQLEASVASHLGFSRSLTSVGQVYPRSLDFDVVSALVQLAAAPSSLAKTIREAKDPAIFVVLSRLSKQGAHG